MPKKIKHKIFDKDLFSDKVASRAGFDLDHYEAKVKYQRYYMNDPDYPLYNGPYAKLRKIILKEDDKNGWIRKEIYKHDEIINLLEDSYDEKGFSIEEVIYDTKNKNVHLKKKESSVNSANMFAVLLGLPAVCFFLFAIFSPFFI